MKVKRSDTVYLRSTGDHDVSELCIVRNSVFGVVELTEYQLVKLAHEALSEARRLHEIRERSNGTA